MSEDQRIIDTIACSLCHCSPRSICGEHLEMAEDILDALRRSGVAVTQLPEPDKGRDDWLGGTVQLDDYRLVLIELCTAHSGGPHFLAPVEANALAAALLAAAVKAQEEQP